MLELCFESEGERRVGCVGLSDFCFEIVIKGVIYKKKVILFIFKNARTPPQALGQ